MLLTLLIAIPAFLIAITLLVAIHEYGHFWVARKLGVKVTRFSIGFGKIIWRKTPKNSDTEYALSMLPVGGYVKMLDERFEENIAPADIPRAYNRQSPWKRILILFAGPLANFLFAILAFYLLFLYGVQDRTAILQPSGPNSPAAQAGLQAGDQVTAVNGSEVESFEAMLLQIVDGVISDDELNLRVDRNGQVRDVSLHVNSQLASLEEPSLLLEGLGIEPWWPDYYPVLEPAANTPAEIAGLKAGDQVIEVEGNEIINAESFIREIQARPSQTVSILVLREGSQKRVQLVTAEKQENGANIGIIGASVGMPQEVFEKLRTKVRYGPINSLRQAFASTYEMSALSLKMFAKMLKGNVSLKNLSGPLSIAEEASYRARSGIDQYVKFLALISIALGIVNLLPVPMLDGGQIVFNVMELVKGSPVTQRTELVFQQVGFMCIFLLMGLAIYNDIERLFL